MKIQKVPVELVQQLWPSVEGFLASANEYGGDDYTLDQIRLFVGTGQWLLLVAVDEQNKIHGAAAVIFQNYPNHRVAFVMFIGGKLISSKDTFGQMVEIFKAHGATRIQGAARASIARLWKRYGFYERHAIVETNI
jgi:hypothetical protein